MQQTSEEIRDYGNRKNSKKIQYKQEMDLQECIIKCLPHLMTSLHFTQTQFKMDSLLV